MPLIQLRAEFPARQIVTDPVELITFEVDAGFDRGQADGAFFPENAADVSKLAQWALAHAVPLVARGAGTGLSGGAVPERGGVIVEFARMNRLLELDTTGRNAQVEPGIINLQLDGAAKAAGLYFPPDPSSGRASVLGGNLGENAGGPHCFKYGVTTNYITGVEAVLGGGAIIHTGGQAFDYPEYDLTGLLVGSEGTLAILTRAEVRLVRNPPAVKTMMAAFPSAETAGAAVSAIIAAGLMPATLEMMDQQVMGMIEAFVQCGLPVEAEAALIVEVDGHPASLDGQVAEIAELLARHGGYQIRIAQDEEERSRIWYGRKSAAGAFSRLSPAFYLIDITVPRSQLSATLAEVNAICQHYALRCGHVFHAGDGNLHPAILCDPRNGSLMERVFAASHEIVACAVKRDGSITGEHGVGIEKRDYMPLMYSAAELAAMLDVKAAFDPANLLNPGKIFPPVRPPVPRPTPAMQELVPDRGDSGGGRYEPHSAAEVQQLLLAAGQQRQTVRISSGEDRHTAAWLLNTGGLAGIRQLAIDDLFVTAGAGTPLAAVEEALAGSNLFVPVAAAHPAATLGGLIAANANAPLRMRYGGWRDNLLCTTVVLADGRIIRAGRPVVKNVAGYDLPKLLVGAHGTLGVLTEVTLKLSSRPRATTTVAVPVADPLQGLAWGQATSRIWLATASVVITPGSTFGEPFLLSFTLEGLPEDVAAEQQELATALRKAGAPSLRTVEQSGVAAWRRFLNEPGEQLRVGVPPQHLRLWWSMISQTVREQSRWFFDVAAGQVWITPRRGAMDAQRLAALRQPALAVRGYAALVQPPLDSRLDRWGYRPDGLDIMRRIKAAWDPAQILNPGEFVV